MTSRPRRRTALPALLALLAPLAAVLALVGLAAPAQAQSFRYWGYYTADGSGGDWGFAQVGPAEAIPADGAVEGWRFAVTGEASNRFPRAVGDFAVLCEGVEAEEGSKRVGVVIDYGTDEDAPEGDEVPAARGDCALVPLDATGSDVLAAVAELRIEDGGFICGIDGYPSAGCGDEVAGEAPNDDEQAVTLALPDDADSDGGSGGGLSSTLLLGVAAVVGLLAATVLLLRRRNREDGPAA
jgi:hypothetical protein